MKGWLLLGVTLLVGVALGATVTARGPAIVAPYLPRAMNSPRERIEGEVVRKQRDGNRLLVKVATTRGPMLVAFTQKVADLDVLLDPGDIVSLVTTGYATFIDDPVFDGVKRPERASPSPPGSSASPPAGAR